ncbi:tripartite tricarboxylate transporter substrate binding protein [Azospirillum sp. RWY-5-1]|uniref:Tripartite tricarboxylate transporter substrate binding protein n=1 Tax=Azospirillum oleiclasticum TaxID=2735135 RepID=A0ABX2T9W1_9PROT|nr:tripartite tricarboxylate transporter substrate binding protein [Azospirillum oleiclasticum]NYZ13923.1 tripartite tricarboxylate transporter substrate binding protein [Azospirillum oleiclasticum]NYZ20847.1 tripartite tricarboxylate transporter substrate binding protein [Azospirillum oleiclasticum]
MNIRNAAGRVAVAVLALGVPLAAGPGAAAGYPDKPVTIVAPFSAGGDSDLAARNLANVAQKYLNQPVMVVNKTGASGVTGSNFVAKSKGDGYTLLLARVGSQAVTPALQPNIPYKWDDFTFIGLLELNPYACAVRADSPIKSFDDLVQRIKDKPGTLTYSTAGVGTIHGMGPQLLFERLGLDKSAATEIPFKGGGEASTALVGGHVDFGCSNVATIMPHIQSRAVRGLVVTTPERYEGIPDVPTAREVGYPELERITGWSALYGPPNMDKAAVEQWSKVLTQVKNDKEWADTTRKLGSVPQVRSPQETEAFAKEQFETYDGLARKLGLRQGG